MFFWLVITGILALTLYSVWRSWSAQLNAGVTVEQSEIAIYEARIGEIDSDVNANRLDSEMAEAAKAEEARKLLKNQGNLDQPNYVKEQVSGWWMTLGLFTIPLVSVLIYLNLGTPPGDLVSTETPKAVEQSMEQLIASAERRLETNPDDLQGWQVLAPVYLRQQNFEKAEKAFRSIIRIEGESTESLSALGEVLVAQSGGQVSTDALQAFQRAIQINPANSNARFFVGLSALQNGDRATARSTWQSMLDDAQGDEEWIPVMKRRVAELDGAPRTAPTTDVAEDIANLPEDERRARILYMVSGLAARLEEDPSNKRGWIRLVRSYIVLGQVEDAEDAMKSAQAKFPNDVEFSAELKKAFEATQGADN